MKPIAPNTSASAALHRGNDDMLAVLEHGAALLTFDEHFRVVEGLRSGHELASFLP